VPPQGVTVLDPVFTTSRVTRVHGYLVFDTLLLAAAPTRN